MFEDKRILIVDDEPDIREILADELRFEGAEVHEAHNGRSAQDVIERQPADKKFDVILTDIRMPGGDGLSLAKYVRSLPPPRPIVFLVTGFADVPAAEAYNMGAEGYFTKPFQLDLLKTEIQRLLAPEPDRWRIHQIQPPQHVLRLQYSFEESRRRGQISLGRAGMFVRGYTAVVAPGQSIQVFWSEDEWVTGVVRWVRAESKGKLEAGFGVEFLSMSEPLISQIKEDRSKGVPEAFIPSAAGAAS